MMRFIPLLFLSLREYQQHTVQTLSVMSGVEWGVRGLGKEKRTDVPHQPYETRP